MTVGPVVDKEKRKRNEKRKRKTRERERGRGRERERERERRGGGANFIGIISNIMELSVYYVQATRGIYLCGN